MTSAVSTTTIAGVMAIRKGLAKPIGSLAEMGTIRLGKRTENRSPLIKEFVPLAELNDIVFGGWDIFEDNCYEAAKHAGVLEDKLLEQIKDELAAIKPMPAVFDRQYVKRLDGPNVKKGKNKKDLADQLIADHVQEGDIYTRLGIVPDSTDAADTSHTGDPSGPINMPIVQAAHGMANMTPQGQKLLNRAQSAVGHVQNAVQRAEQHPIYQVAGAAHGIVQDLRQDPLVRQHVIEPIKAHPVAQAAGGIARDVAAPVMARVNEARQDLGNLVQQANEAAAPVVPAVQRAGQTAQVVRDVKQQYAPVADEVRQHGIIGAVKRQISGEGPQIALPQALTQAPATPAGAPEIGRAHV